MLIVIAGLLGSGKTLLLTFFDLLTILFTERQIVSNYTLNNVEYEKFSLFKYAKSEYDNSTISIDEIYTLLDARMSNTTENSLLSYTLFQSRKKSIDTIATLQLFSTLDLRYRDLSNLYIHAVGLVSIKNKVYYKYLFYFKGFNKPKKFYLSLDIAQILYNFYNTNELIEPKHKSEMLYSFKTPNEIKTECKAIAKKLYKEFVKENKKINYRTVKLYLFDNDLPKKYFERVYQYAKEIEDKNV